MTDVLDDSILNNVAEDLVAPNMELNDDEINKLLGENHSEDVEMVEDVAEEGVAEAGGENSDDIDDEGFEDSGNLAPDAEKEEEDVAVVSDDKEEEKTSEEAPEDVEKDSDDKEEEKSSEEVAEDVVPLDDKEEEKASEETSEGVESSEAMEDVTEEMIVEEEVFNFDDDDDVAALTSEDVTNRKREASTSEAAPTAHKRARGDRPFFEARQKVIETIQSIYGNWDCTLQASQLRILSDMRRSEYMQIIQTQKQINEDLEAKVRELTEKLYNEKCSHAATQSLLKEFQKEVTKNREQVRNLSGMITQPPTEELVGTEQLAPPQRSASTMSSVSQPGSSQQQQHMRLPPPAATLPRGSRPVPPHRYQGGPPSGGGRYEQAMQQQQQRAIRTMPPPQQHYLTNRNPPMFPTPPTSRQQQQQSYQNGSTPRRLPPPQSSSSSPELVVIPSPQSIASHHSTPSSYRHQQHQQPQTPKFEPIPPPGMGMGHHHPPTNESPQTLIDVSIADQGIIMVAIPHIPMSKVISCGDAKRLPIIPKVLAALHKTPDLVVSLSSTAADFRENWQIAGKINYENMPQLEKKNIQLYIQVASLKACGLYGRPMDNQAMTVNWGISKQWQCNVNKKSHRFRVTWHQNQVVPLNDRIVIMVVVRNSSNGAMEACEPVYLNLT